MVRQHIEDLPADPQPEDIPDELIGSVVILSGNHKINVRSREDWPKSRFYSPLATLHCLDMWGLVPMLPPHKAAVIQLVKMKGGIHMMQSKALARVVQLLDLLDASRHLTATALPWHNVNLPLSSLRWPCHESSIPDETSPKATSAIEALSSTILNYHDLKFTVSAIQYTINLLKEYLADGCPGAALSYLSESRDRAQYYALNLPPMFRCLKTEYDIAVYNEVESDSLKTSEKHVYETMRLALLIFNNLVIYPMPPPSGIDTRLARFLRQNIHAALEADAYNKEDCANLLLWALVLGGISDHYNLNRSWYIEQVQYILAERPELRTWIKLEQLLTSFLWLDYVLNEEAMKFWLEAIYPKRVESGK